MMRLFPLAPPLRRRRRSTKSKSMPVLKTKRPPPGGEKRHHSALNRASRRTPLDLLRGSLTLQNVLEVAKVLLELQLGVGYRPGGNLPDLAPRRVRVVHLHL